MAKFEEAIDVILDHEGGFVDHPKDPGGATNYGISLKWLQREGMDLDQSGAVDVADILFLTVDKAKELYRTGFWNPMRCEEINDQTIATKHFDMGVNMGVRRAVRILQTSCNSLGSKLMVDGIPGPNTIHEANRWEPRFLLKELQLEQRVYYKTLVNLYPDKFTVFLKGWLDRAAWPSKK